MRLTTNFLNITQQNTECIVNAWNRNFIPYWLLIPQGVSKAIKKDAGNTPFKEVYKKGFLKTGDAVLTSAGNLNMKGIIHVAGINMCWVSTENSIRLSTKNAMELSIKNNFSSIVFPLIGAGTGGKKRERVQSIMQEEFEKFDSDIEVILSLYEP